MAIASRDHMGGLAKGLKVIETFSKDSPRQAISEVSTKSGLDRATTRRCLLTLSELGYADYDGKYFTLTSRVLRLGMSCLATMPLAQMVQPWLEGLSRQFGESCSVAILDEADIVYVARASQKKVMSIALMPGARLPAYCTSIGRVLLAALPEESLEVFLSQFTFKALTPNTIYGVDALRCEIEQVRKQGYALVDQEVELGLRSIAVPILNSRDETVAAMNFGVAAVDETPRALRLRFLMALLKTQTEIRTVLET